MATLLVIDDDDALARLCARHLGRAHDVELTSDPQDAIARVRTGRRYDAIVCDVQLPAMSGFAVHDAIAAIDLEQARRIVFVTGGSFEAEVTKRRLANRLLRKPFRAQDLLAAVETFLPIGLVRR